MATQTFDNYTITDVTYQVTGGTNVYSAHQTAVLTISPNDGYTVDAGDFSWINTSLANVNTVVFTQSGTNVLVTVTFDNPFTMPSSDTTLGLCIAGAAIRSYIGLTGQYKVAGDDTNMSIVDDSPVGDLVYFDINGEENQEVLLISKTYTASSGYAFETDFEVVLNVENPNSYNVIYTKTLDDSNNLTSINIKIYYTFPSSTVVDDRLDLVIPDRFLIYVPENKVRAYSFLQGNSIVGPSGCVKTVRFYGNPTATFTLATSNGSILDVGEITTDGQDDTVFYATTPTLTIPDSGYYDINIYIPASNSATTYTFTLAGDLVSPFPQANPFTILQKPDTTLTFSASGTGFTVSNVSPSSTSYTKTFTANSEPTEGSTAYDNSYLFNVTATNGNQITVDDTTTDTFGTWSNLKDVDQQTTSAISNTLVIPVNDSTGITTGMRFISPLVTSSSVYTVDSINGNNITLTGGANLTLPNFSNISFSNRSGSELQLPITATVDDAGTSAQVKGVGVISRYGDENKTFNLDLATVFTIGSSNPCKQFNVTVGTGGGLLSYYDCITNNKRELTVFKGQANFNICALASPAPTVTGTMSIAAHGSNTCAAGGASNQGTCTTWTIVYNPAAPRGKSVTVTYIDCVTLAEATITVGLGSTVTQCATRQTPVSSDPGDGGATITLTDLTCSP